MYLKEKNKIILEEVVFSTNRKWRQATILQIVLYILFFLLAILSIFLFFWDKDLQTTIDNLTHKNEQLQHEINALSSNYSLVLIIGGRGEGNRFFNSIIAYNVTGKSWNKCQLQLPKPLFQSGATVFDNEIYIFGGQNSELLSSGYKLKEDGQWEMMLEMNEKKAEFAGHSVVFKSEIWVIGGWNGTHTLNTVEKYNPKTNSWTKMPNLLEKRYAAAASVIAGKIYVSGGFDADQAWRQSMEIYDPAKNRWEYFTSLPYGLTDHCSVADGMNLMIIGGKKNDDTFSNEVWKIDITDPERKWKKMPSFKQKRRYHGAVKLKDGLMIFGGIRNYTTQLNSVEIFDGTSWSEGPPMPEKFGEFAFIPITRKQEKSFVRQFCRTE